MTDRPDARYADGLGPEPAPLVSLPSVVRVGAGSATPIPVAVTNTASEPRELLVLAVGVDQGWLPGPVRTRVLASGETEQVMIRLAPTTGTLPAEYPLAVTVQSVVPATGRASTAPTGLGETSVVVNPRAQLDLDVEPEQTRFVRSRTIRLTLRNTGVTPATVDLAGVATKGLLVRLGKREVTVPAGGETRVRGRLVANRPRRIGGSLTHSWTITATSPEIVRQVRGSAQQRAVFGNGFMKAVALVAVVAVWAAAVLVLVQEVPKRLNKEEASASAEGGSGGGEDGGGGSNGAGGAGGKGGKVEITQAKAGKPPTGAQFTGTVTATDPKDVVVTVDAISLSDQEAEDAENIDQVRTVADYGSATGKLVPSSFLLSLPSAPDDKKRSKLHACDTRGECTATTTEDGTWAVLDVQPTGYYLITFTKPGLDTRSYVVDASSFDPTEPLEVEMEPGDGSLSGTVRDAGGRLLGGAEVTVSDGTSTITTSTASQGGDVGRWEVAGLATPATYTVAVSSFGLGTETRLVDLQADGSERVDVELRPGVAALSGLVTGDVGGDTDHLGGVTVTVADSEGQIRTVTTTTQGNQRGRYSLSGIPVPGEYTVTMSAPGYQTDIRRLRLDDHQGQARLGGNLTLATGMVTGRVLYRADGNPVEGAGLVLTDGEHTYKTTSNTENTATQSEQVGGFAFTGVEPGLYRLTTSFFKYRDSVLTVEVPAGDPVRINPRLQLVPGGVVVPSTSTVKGSIREAGTGVDVECDDPADDCATAALINSDGDVVEQIDFEPGDDYLLPDPDGAIKGVTPGLYTVRVEVPHYETAQTRVQVGLDADVVAETIELVKAPKIVGELTAVVDRPAAGSPTCIWAGRPGALVADDGSPLDCAEETDTTCPVGESEYGDPTDRLLCVRVDRTGSYSIEVPTRGQYQVYVQPTDPEYLAQDPVQVNAPGGGTYTHDISLNRYGRLILTTKRPNAGGVLVPAQEAVVSSAPDSLTIGNPTNASGVAVLSGFRPTQAYSISAIWGGGTDDEVGSDAVTVALGLNQVGTLTVPLIKRIDHTVLRVTTGFTGSTTGVDGATVRVTAPVGYAGDSPLQRTGSVLDTDADGCGAIVRNLANPPAATGSSAPDLCDATYTGAALSTIDGSGTAFVSRAASRVEVSHPGYETLVLGTTDLTAGVNRFSLEPRAVPFSGSIDTLPSTDVPPWSQATFRIEPITTPTTTITMSASSGASPTAAGVLHWNDTRYPGGQIKPGRYRVTASMPGYLSDTREISCLAVSTTCSFGSLQLKQLGSLTVRTLTSDGADDGTDADPVNNTVVTLLRGTEALAQRSTANDDNQVSFSDLSPDVTNYRIRVQAAGFDPKVYPVSVAAGDPPSSTLACDGVAVGTVTIAPGGTTGCDVTLARLGTITGTLSGVLGDEPATTPTRLLAGANVQATPCTTTAVTASSVRYCTAVNASRRLTTTTDAEGRYAVTGTSSIVGIDEGYWLVTTTQPGFVQPAAPAGSTGAIRGTLVNAPAAGGDIPQDLSMYATKVGLTVRVNDQAGVSVKRATVNLLQGDTVVKTLTGTGADAPYSFTNVIPGQYTLEITGGGVLRTTYQVDVVVGVASQTFQAYASRAVNTVNGTIVGDDFPGGLEGVTVNLVSCTNATTCGTAVAEGTNEQPLTTTTGGDGSFTIRTVPNGWFAVRLSKLGYAVTQPNAVMFDHTIGTVPVVAATMVSTKRTVNVVLDPSTDASVLSGAQVSLTPVEVAGNLNGAKNSTATSNTVQFPDVRFGCWDVALTLPTGHYGDIDLPADVTNAALGCTGNVVVPPAPSATTLTATIEVTETELRVSLTATPQTGHAAPTTARVRVTGTGVAYDNLSFPVGSASTYTTLWVRPGSVTVRADAPGSFSSVFWPAHTPAAINVTENNGPRTAALALTEGTGSQRVSVTGASAAQPATITVAPGPGQTASLPAAYANPITVTSAANRTFDLPSGQWTFTASFGVGGTDDVETVTVDQATEPVLTMTPTPPEAEEEDPGP